FGTKRETLSRPILKISHSLSWISVGCLSEDIKQVDKTLDELIEKAEKYKDDNAKETRKFMQHNKHKPIWNKTKDGMKTQMMIGFVIVKTKDGQEKKMIFASGSDPLYSKQLTDDKQTREKLQLEKTNKGFEFINTDFKGKDLDPCAAKKALEYVKTKIGLENLKSFQLGEIFYEYKNNGNRTQPNTNGKSFAKSCDNCVSYYQNEDNKASQNLI
ncbi:hypothetical protein BpHYR1_034741, partial [Brachionus plicatilis]